MVYAQLNENNICFALSQVSQELNKSNLIKLDSVDVSLLGKQYNNGIWEEVEVTPESQSTTTQQDRIEAGIDYLVMLSQ